MNFKNQFINHLNNKIQINFSYDDIKHKIDVNKYINNEKKNLLNLFKTNKKYKIAGLTALSVLLVLGVGLPVALANEQSSQPSIDYSDNPFFPADSIFDLYRDDYFPLLKVKNVSPIYYYFKEGYPHPNENDEKVILSEFEVVGNDYGQLTLGTTIYIPFKTQGIKSGNNAINLVSNWLYSLDYICVNFDMAGSNCWFWNIEKTEWFVYENTCLPCFLTYENTIPIIDGKVNFDSLNPYTNEYSTNEDRHRNYYDYDEYIYEGMPLEELLSTISLITNYNLQRRK